MTNRPQPTLSDFLRAQIVDDRWALWGSSAFCQALIAADVRSRIDLMRRGEQRDPVQYRLPVLVSGMTGRMFLEKLWSDYAQWKMKQRRRVLS